MDPVVQAALPVSAPVAQQVSYTNAVPAIGAPVYTTNFAPPVAAAAPAAFRTANYASPVVVAAAPASVVAAAPSIFSTANYATPFGVTAGQANFGLASNVYNHAIGGGCMNVWGAQVPCAL